ncbi:unnamed protein product [Phaeothamnion confervicola]
MSVADIESLSEAAMAAGRNTYVDPQTGYSVMTAKSHLARGMCCGNGCHHCPYGHFNVVNAARRTNNITKTVLLRHSKTERPDKETDASNTSALFWSGGKDSFLTFLDLKGEAATTGGRIMLVTTFAGHTGAVAFQGMHISDIMTQAKQLGVDLLAVPLTAGLTENAEMKAADIRSGSREDASWPNRSGSGSGGGAASAAAGMAKLAATAATAPAAAAAAMAAAAAGGDFDSTAAAIAITGYEGDGEGPYMEAVLAALEPHRPRVKDLVFGDLHLADIRRWREDAFGRHGYHCRFPLFNRPYSELLAALFAQVEAGAVEVKVGAVRKDLDAAGIVKVGVAFDAGFAAGLPDGIDRMGENGEFHTHVFVRGDSVGGS